MVGVFGYMALLNLLCTIISLNFIAAISQPTSVFNLSLPSQNPQSLSAASSDVVVSDSAFLGDGDPDFRVIPHIYDTKLDLIYCLLTAVEAALQLSLGNYESVLVGRMAFKFNESSTVEIEIIPNDQYGPGPKVLMWKFAVWALNESIDLMLKARKFRAAAFTIQYKNWDLGVILYSLITVTGSDDLPSEASNMTSRNVTKTITANGTKDLQSGGLPSTVNITSALNTHPDLDLRFQFVGMPVALTDVFSVVLDLLRDLAHFNPAARLIGYWKRIGSANLIFNLQDPNSPPRSARHPPYLQAEWVVRTLAQIPTYMIEHSFREIEVVMYVDDLRIGEISLTKTRGPLIFDVNDD